MSTCGMLLHEVLAEGREPDSLWLTEQGTLEVRFVDGEVVPLPDAAVGSRRFNKMSRKAWLDATDRLLRVAMLCGWEESEYETAIVYIREFPTVAGQSMQIYPE